MEQTSLVKENDASKSHKVYNEKFAFMIGKTYKIKFIRFGEVRLSKLSKGNYRFATIKLQDEHVFRDVTISQPIKETPTSLWWQLDKLNALMGNDFFNKYFDVIVWPKGKFFDVIIIDCLSYVADAVSVQRLSDGEQP